MKKNGFKTGLLRSCENLMLSRATSDQKSTSICVVIPVRNVEKMIGKVLHEIIEALKFYKIEILILDNASNDRTKENVYRVFQLFENKENLSLRYILNEMDLGYGGSLKKGLTLAKSSGYQWIMIAHGDDQADWSSITSLILATLKSNKYDLIITSRFMRGSHIENYSLQRKLGNYFFRIVTNKLMKTKMSDPGAAIIAIKSEKLILRWISDLRNDYLFHPGLNIIFFTSNLSISEIPMNWRDASHPGEIKLIKYGFSLMKFIVLAFANRKIRKYSWIESVARASNL
jgi:dolichol-phosphate mannosyltransferase